MSGIIDWLICALKNVINWTLDMLADVWYYTIGLLIGLLPNSPFTFEKLDWGDFGKWVGYFIPIPRMAQHFTLILASIALYYLLRNALRLARTIK